MVIGGKGYRSLGQAYKYPVFIIKHIEWGVNLC